MSDKVKVGIIGTSWYADFVHLPNMANAPDADLVAVCGRNLERAQEVAKKHNIPHIFSDYRDLLAHPLDAVVIATPDDTHFEMVMAALDADKHVLCEKPLALNAADARAMYEKAEAKKLKHMTFFSYRFMPHHQHVKRLIDEGYLGDIYQLSMRYMGGFGRDGSYNWRFDARRSNGNLGDMGSHAVDLARWFAGDVARVRCQLNTFMDHGNASEAFEVANDAATLSLDYKEGAQGSIQVSAVSHLADRRQEQYILLTGEKGSLELSFPRTGIELRGVKHDEDEFKLLDVPDILPETVPFFERFLAYLARGDQQFIDAILYDEDISPDFYDGLKAQETIDAALLSAQSRNVQKC